MRSFAIPVPGADGHMTKEEFVARHVREAIIAGRLAPGERIRQQRLADELGVSPTPVREALRSLATEGWVQLTPHVGMSVAQVDDSLVDEVYRIREMLESRLAAEAAVGITDAQLVRLREIHEKFREAWLRGNHGAARAENFHFHAAVWEAAGWPVAVGLLQGLWAQVPIGRMTDPSRESRTLQEHGEVLAALQRRDPGSAQEALAAHIRSGRADYHRAIGLIEAPEDGRGAESG